MAGGQGDQQRLLFDEVVIQPLTAAAGEPQDGGIEPVVAQRLHQCRHGALLWGERHLGVAFAIVVQQGQHRGVEHGRAGKADTQRPLLAAGDPLHLLFGGIGQRQDLGGIPIEARTRLGQLDAASQTAQQRGAEALFQLADLLAQGRLGHVERLGCPGEVLFVDDRHEVAQGSQFHIERVSKSRDRCIGVEM